MSKAKDKAKSAKSSFKTGVRKMALKVADRMKEEFVGPCPKCEQDICECAIKEQFELFRDYLLETEVVKTEDEAIDMFETIEDADLEEYLEQAVQMKGKKKGNVIINPEVKKVDENADASKKMQIQKKQLMLNKQKVALQQKATSKKNPADMHLESTEDLQEVDTSTRAVEFGAEIERTNVRRKKEKKSLKDFKKLSMGRTKSESVEEVEEVDESLKQARKNVGADKCWKGYKAKGTKMKDGRQVPNCVKEDEAIEEGKKGLWDNIHAKRKRGERPARPGEKDYPKTLNVEEVENVNEEDADRLRDRRMERGGVDGNTNYKKAPKPTNTAGKKKPYDGMSAMDKVKADIRAKYGHGAIIDTKKK